MASTMVVVPRSKADAILVALNWKSAPTWTLKRMQEKILLINTIVDDDTKLEDPDLQAVLAEILAAIDEGGQIDVQDDAENPTPAEKPAAKKGGGKKKPAPVEEAAAADDTDPSDPSENELEAGGAETNGEETGVDAEAPAAPAKTKGTTAAAKPAAAKNPAGVRMDTKGRPYFAAVVIKKHGIEAGITDAMAKEVDALVGKPNTKESLGWLRVAHQCVRGYVDGVAAGE